MGILLALQLTSGGCLMQYRLFCPGQVILPCSARMSMRNLGEER
jgi:hypothetical protein